MSNLYSNLHKLYSVQKTLRFELKPVGNTLEKMKESGIIDTDVDRIKKYKKVKKYCDEFHKYFINESLKDLKLSDIDQYYMLYKIDKKTDREKEEFKKVQEKMRTQISNAFKKNDLYKGLMQKEIIENYIVELYKNDENAQNDIKSFKNFTTYFTGYNQNRENMYVADEKSTAIAYRLINENLPTFISNMKIFKIASEKIGEKFDTIYQDLEEYMQVSYIDEMFELDYFNNTLTQIGIENYNILISGKSVDENKKIKGLNEYINEYNQLNKEGGKIPKLKELYKQILSDRVSSSFKFDAIENDTELIELIDEYYKNYLKCLNDTDNSLVKTLESIAESDLSKIYINNDLSLTEVSNKVFGDWNYINDRLNEEYDKNHTIPSKNIDKYIERRKKELKNTKQFDLEYLDKITNKEQIITNYFKNYLVQGGIIESVEAKYERYQNIREKYLNETRDIIKNENDIAVVKELLDSLKSLQELIKILIPKDRTVEKDDVFYNDLYSQYEILVEIIPLYNKARNYVTQKPYSDEKVKINFNCPTLLNGWDLNKEKDNLGVLFEKDEKYYLGVMTQENKNVFDNTEYETSTKGYYRKMEYKLLPGPNKMLPKVFFSKSRIEEFNPSKELLEKYSMGLHKKGDSFDLNFCHELIDFYKDSINKHEDWKKFGFNFTNTNEYNDISEFYKEVETQGYKIEYKNYSEDYIDELVKEGKLYLFQIYNKDFSKYSKGNPNLHTMYWKALFDKENLKNVVYKLNGNAEVFYRKASINIEDTAIHRANVPVKNKNVDTINQGRETSIFNYDLIKDKRYTEDKFQFHVPITLNFKNMGLLNINEIVNTSIKKNDNVYAIGIDRGERNLLYVCVVDNHGKIVEQKSLNEIVNEYNNTKYKTNYHNLLDNKEKAREEARESWKSVENIKELKEGYMSQVIHVITEMAKRYNAIIVLEDLNNGFKNSRIKVEKQVYQKFEKMLIDKLNYLIFKNEEKNEEGGLLNAYQLTNKFESFNKMGKQSGILFYIPAWNTSKIDPTTGFVNLFYIKSNETNENSKVFFNRIDDIRYNESENYFEFDIDYSKFNGRYENTRRNWILCSYGERIITYRNPEKDNRWDNKKINLTDEFLKLFQKYEIDFKNIIDSVNACDNFNYKEFIQLFKLMVQMRNSMIGETEDYMISPIKNKYGYFYNSQTASDNLPKDADGNGAYNIARKGLMLIEQIKKTEEKLGSIKYNITNEEWLKYAQNEENV